MGGKLRASSRVGALVSWALAVACAPPRPSWTEVRSRHFVLKSDVSPGRAEELVRDLEHSYAALRSCITPGIEDPPGVTEVVAFDNEDDYRKVAPASGGRFVWTNNLIESSRRILFPANSSLYTASRQETLQHELTHRFVAHYMPNVPLWFNEGLAEFMSTARLEDDVVVMGDPPSEHWLSASGWMVEQRPLVRLSPDPAFVRTHTSGSLPYTGYIGAWMLVHVMLLGDQRHREALEAYVADLRSGTLGQSEAFAAHFDATTVAAIDEAYSAFQKRTQTPTQAVRLDAPPTLDVVSRPVPPVEALAVHGRLHTDTNFRMLALEDANRAISIDPKSPEGYLLRAIAVLPNSRAAATDLRTAIRLAPDDARLRRGLGAVLLSLDGPTTEVKGLVEWVQARAASADDFRFLATWELRMKHPERAIELAKKGISLDIFCLRCYEVAASAAAYAKDHEGAVRWQRRAVNVAADHAGAEMLERLARYEAELKSPTPKKEPPLLTEKHVIHAAVQARRAEFDACYEAGLARNGTLRGKVVVLFVVGVEGSVTDASDGGSELGDQGVITCALDRIRGMKFDPPAKGPRTHRLVFRFPKQ